MMIFGLNMGPLGGHLGGWRHPDAFPTSAMRLENAIAMARLAEQGKLDALFLADGSGVRQMDKPKLFAANSPSDRPVVFEPVTLYAALSQHVKHIGMVATATTSFEPPFILARKFASLDHLSQGRAGWNLVTTQYIEDAKNFGRDEHFPRDVRYEMAQESFEVVQSLWDSWASDAFLQDKATGQYLDPAKVKLTNHRGKYFAVKGPLNVARCPQGHPVVFMAGQSEAGRELAAYGAEGLFGSATTIEEAQSLYADIKGRMPKYGRAPETMKILPSMVVYTGRTMDEAQSFYEELQSYIAPDLGLEYLSKMIGLDLTGYALDDHLPPEIPMGLGGTAISRSVHEMALRENLTVRETYQRILPAMGGNMVIGDPKHIADVFEEWHTTKACDGFMLSMPVQPKSLRDFVTLVVPELQRRGLMRQEYTDGATLRDLMRLPTPPDPFAAGQTLAAE